MASSAQAADLSAVYDAALAGDMAKALSILDGIAPATMTAAESSAAACMRRRFSTPPQGEELPPRSRRILDAYRRYWQDAMLRRASTEEVQRKLLTSLTEILAGDGPPKPADLDAASERAREAIEAEGLFALTGVTLPYYELMVWRTRSPRAYRVALPEDTVDVHVVFLDDFVSLGWAAYATCDRSFSGGWATRDSLYAVRSAYHLGTENFRVSYLAHEGQHFADYEAFPELEQPELEYRAKLTELALSDTTTHDLISAFARRGGRERTVPHQFAEYWVARDLAEKCFGSRALVTDGAEWRGISAGRIREQAKRLLLESSDRLRRLGPASVERFLPDPPPGDS